MNKFFLLVINRHQDIIRYVIILSSILIISFFFPNTGIFKYEFARDKPWKYDDLYAPFDIVIKKTQKQLDEEREFKKDEFSPYYRFDPKSVANEKQKFVDAFNAKLKESGNEKVDSQAVVQLGLNVLDTIYAAGIIDLIDEHKSLSGDKTIRVFTSRNEVTDKYIGDFLSIKKAFDFARDTLKNARRDQLGFLLPLVQQSLNYNVMYDEAATKRHLDELFEKISLTRGQIQEGEKIIAKGGIVTDEKYLVLLSYKEEYESNMLGEKVIFLGNFLLVFIILAILSAFIRVFSPDVWTSNRKHLLVFLLITLMIIVIHAVVKKEITYLYAVPLCIIPVILRTFFGTTLALHAHIALVLLSIFIVPDGIRFGFLQFIAGMVAILTNTRGYYWSKVVISNGFILITYLLGYLALSLVEEGAFKEINYMNFGWLSLNVLLTLLAYPLVPLFEKTFGFVSDLTLIEFSDINKPLLKDLSIRAPGTFQHSLQVSNLAEAAASEIGANALLVKVSALYHDIGKMENAVYFIENQNPEVNPHDDLTFEESAKIIIGHVKEGILLAKKHKVPDIIIDFIRTHHGTTVVQYFYNSYLKNFPEKKDDVEMFRYPGPLPYSKETAIVMLADSVEAAARSLKSPSSADIDDLVERIIDYKIKENQLVNSNITFKEITILKKVFKKLLNSIHHVRIAYPEKV